MNAIRVGLVYGSVREGRFCDTVAPWVAEALERFGGFELEVIDPMRLWGGQGNRDARKTELRRQIAAADAFIVVTPEYNHGYTAELKFLIDSAYAEWHAKPVAFVSYGGISGGLRAVEQLRLVFAELHAVTVRDTVSLSNPWARLDGEGRLLASEGTSKAMAGMLCRLSWWATTLHDARNAVPYLEACA